VLDDGLGRRRRRQGRITTTCSTLRSRPWTALRIAKGVAVSLPSPPEMDSAGRAIAILGIAPTATLFGAPRVLACLDATEIPDGI